MSKSEVKFTKSKCLDAINPLVCPNPPESSRILVKSSRFSSRNRNPPDGNFSRKPSSKSSRFAEILPIGQHWYVCRAGATAAPPFVEKSLRYPDPAAATCQDILQPQRGSTTSSTTRWLLPAEISIRSVSKQRLSSQSSSVLASPSRACRQPRADGWRGEVRPRQRVRRHRETSICAELI